MEWVESAGGPLICVERELADLWLGADGSCDAKAGEKLPTDYDRACETVDYASVIAMPFGCSAIILGDLPMSTGVWQDAAGRLIIVRVKYTPSDEAIATALEKLDDSVFELPDEDIVVSWLSPQLVIFDSAWPGRERRQAVEFRLEAGRYRLATKCCEPAKSLALVLHRFDPIHH